MVVYEIIDKIDLIKIDFLLKYCELRDWKESLLSGEEYWKYYIRIFILNIFMF